MGVYHLMGLGRSAGAVTGPLSYLCHRYQRWNEEDQKFFSGSGEKRQSESGQKVGDVQAIILFTTAEVLEGREGAKAYPYCENQPGRTIGTEKPAAPMKEALEDLLRRTWSNLCGNRRTGSLYWCEVNRRDIRNVYERVAQVVSALGKVGGLGKEMWANLTGGNNVINFALELAASLSGRIARLYYVQAQDQKAERCVFYTAENGYWVELPVIPLALSRLSKAIVDLLESKGPLSLDEIYSRLQTEHWGLLEGVDSKITLKENHLSPMWRQKLIAGDDQAYSVGAQWRLVQPYDAIWREVEEAGLTIEQLAQEQPWLTHQEIQF